MSHQESIILYHIISISVLLLDTRYRLSIPLLVEYYSVIYLSGSSIYELFIFTNNVLSSFHYVSELLLLDILLGKLGKPYSIYVLLNIDNRGGVK